jgi:HAD superfamily hydrolase (TIGR01509 family)
VNQTFPQIKALLFDQDGVIVDTERDGHRVAFNKAFKEFGLPFEWDIETYGDLLKIAGGKERLKHFLHTRGMVLKFSNEEEDQFIRQIHERKTDIFIELIEKGQLPLRPGVKRLMQEAKGRGLRIGICTTSSERAAKAITSRLLSEIEVDILLAGDVVKKKKPDPEIYLLALEKLNLDPKQCIVIEDSKNGVLAAKQAGIHVVATPSTYTMEEDLSLADLIVTNLGDSEGEKGILLKGNLSKYDGIIYLSQLLEYFSKD